MINSRVTNSERIFSGQGKYDSTTALVGRLQGGLRPSRGRVEFNRARALDAPVARSAQEYFVYFKIFNAVRRKKIRCLGVLIFFKHALVKKDADASFLRGKDRAERGP